MSDFPAIQNHSHLSKVVSARDLHSFLEINRDFPTWLSGRIDQYLFCQGVDFICDSFPQNGGKGGRPTVEYFITIDMAKELAMIERNEKGKQVRKYFIECEKKLLNSMPALPNFNDPVESARAWADAKESEIKALCSLEAAKPAIEFVERYTNAEGLKGFREVCKLIGAKENQFRDFLIHKRIMYRLNGAWTAYASHIEAGRFEIKTGLSDADHSFNQAMFTAKGVAWVSQLWSEK